MTDLYVDDNALRWKFGDQVFKITDMLTGVLDIMHS